MEQAAPAYEGDEPYVFISYSHQDQALVFREIQWLQEQGVKVWYDTQIQAGSEWSDALARAIGSCSRFLYFITPNSVASENCRRELNYAIEEGRSILTVHLEDTEVPGGIRLNLNNRHAILKHRLAPEVYRSSLLGALPTDSARPESPTTTVSSSGLNVRLVSVIAATLLIAVSAVWFLQRAPEQRDKASDLLDAERPPAIAVLPFDNLDDTDDYFGDGVAEELLNRMVRLRNVRVISRHSSFAYGESELDIREIGKNLGANYILQGSVRRDAGIVRIAVHLTDSAAGTEIWANSYDRELVDMLRVQDEIARAVVGELLPNIAVTRSVQPTVDPLAYELYLQARSAIAANDPISAKPLLQSAITLDDDFSNAYAALADVHESLRIYGSPAFVGNEELQRVLDRALELDPENVEALAVEAILEFYVHSDTKKAVSTFERLLRGSSNTRALHHYRQLLIAMGKFEDLLLIAKRRGELDPHSRITTLTEFWAYMWLGEFSMARKAASRLPLEAVSESGWSGRRPWLIMVDLATGQLESADAHINALDPEFDEQGRLYFQLWSAIERGNMDVAKKLYAANPIAMSALPFSTWLPFDVVLTGEVSRTIDEIEHPTDPRSIVWITQLRSRDRWVSENLAPVFGEAFESLRRDQRYGRALERYGIDEGSLSRIELHTADLWD